ncbi:hypothetical protein [Arenibaculum pallidiluteum]|uniref:hypothetical protein n=1 Tax=Arenibaculum pallidiluteum TaxID=2812559 RepID=UPI001A97B014|nr:hypothetical protein [Arenibaculum pallidiluteum]
MQRRLSLRNAAVVYWRSSSALRGPRANADAAAIAQINMIDLASQLQHSHPGIAARARRTVDSLGLAPILGRSA